jgi:hypothetical protein
MFINDEHQDCDGEFVLSIENAVGEMIICSTQKYAVPTLGQTTHFSDVEIPEGPSEYLIKATA